MAFLLTRLSPEVLRVAVIDIDPRHGGTAQWPEWGIRGGCRAREKLDDAKPIVMAVSSPSLDNRQIAPT